MQNQDNIITLIGEKAKREPIPVPVVPPLAHPFPCPPIDVFNYGYPQFVPQQFPPTVLKPVPQLRRELVPISTSSVQAAQTKTSTSINIPPIKNQNNRKLKKLSIPKQPHVKSLPKADLTNELEKGCKSSEPLKPEIKTRLVVSRKKQRAARHKKRTVEEKLTFAKQRYLRNKQYRWIRDADIIFNLNQENIVEPKSGAESETAPKLATTTTQQLPRTSQKSPVTVQKLPRTTHTLPRTTHTLPRTTHTLPKTPQTLPTPTRKNLTTEKLPTATQKFPTTTQTSPTTQNSPQTTQQSLNPDWFLTTIKHKKLFKPTRPEERLSQQIFNTSTVMKKNVFAPMRYPSGVPRSFLTPGNMHLAVQPQPAINTEGLPRTFAAPANMQLPRQPQAPVVNQEVRQSPAPAAPKFISTFQEESPPQRYSPTEAYDDVLVPDADARSDSSDSNQGQKRLSAFQRLGPLSEPKKPKLTIKLCNNEQSVREVLDSAESQDDKFIPVHLRKYMTESRDDLVARFLPLWPWKKTLHARRTVTVRESKSVMMLEREQMEEAYDKSNMYIQVSVKGYPPNWTKENILDTILEAVKGKSFIPCFVESNPDECKFLVIRARTALLMIHKLGFVIKTGEHELILTLSQLDLSLKHIDFIPRLVLRKFLAQGYDGESKLSLSAFTLKPDQSHLIYFPLHRMSNQVELTQIESTVAWDYIIELDLSHNNLTTIDGFNLSRTTPRLKKLDLSHNCLEKVTVLLGCNELPLKSLVLEGNPLCHYYIEPEKYVYAVKLMFPELREIDGIPIQLKGDFPVPKKNYCPEESIPVVEKFLEVFFPLLDSPVEDRMFMSALYHENAVLTITCKHSFRYNPSFKYIRSLLHRSRDFSEGDTESTTGPENIVKIFTKWPKFRHDPTTFCVDVMLHTDNTTIFRVSGILKITADSLADDEHLISFMRTIVLGTKHGIEYKIKNEMLYWGAPTTECANAAFQFTTIPLRRPTFSFEKNPDYDFKENLAKIFMSMTDMDKKPCEKCLELKDWDLKAALSHYMKLVRLDSLDSLTFDSNAETAISVGTS